MKRSKKWFLIILSSLIVITIILIYFKNENKKEDLSFINNYYVDSILNEFSELNIEVLEEYTIKQEWKENLPELNEVYSTGINLEFSNNKKNQKVEYYLFEFKDSDDFIIIYNFPEFYNKEQKKEMVLEVKKNMSEIFLENNEESVVCLFKFENETLKESFSALTSEKYLFYEDGFTFFGYSD